LRDQILALRSALGDGPSGARFIVTVRGRGYMFAARAESRASNQNVVDSPRSSVPNRAGTLRSSLVEIDGSDEIVSEIVKRLLRERAITIRLGLTKYRDKLTAGPSDRPGQRRISVSLE
jgi:hypothetical protein